MHLQPSLNNMYIIIIIIIIIKTIQTKYFIAKLIPSLYKLKKKMPQMSFTLLLKIVYSVLKSNTLTYFR